MSGTLKGKVAIVTGASRGIGKGIAIGLGKEGATVYVTGRTLRDAGPWPGTVNATAGEVTRAGGHGIAVPCDHADDEEVKGVFQRVREENGQLDLLVNNATSFGETPTSHGYDPEDAPFWELPIKQWDEMQRVGLRSHYVASVFASPIMIAQHRGLILNISSAGATVYSGNVAYGVGKAALDKLSADTAYQLKPHGVAAISLWPPLTKTEKVMAFAQRYNMSRAFTPLYTGRAVAALASDLNIMEKTGQALRVTDLAQEYGFSDNPVSS